MMPDGEAMVFGVSDFVAVFNQTIEFAYPYVTIQGELTNFRVSKNRWVYFDLKDEHASVKFFGTVYQLPGPLEDGMLVQVSGQPRLHPLYGFSVTLQNIRPVGEGTLKRAAALLQAKLDAEGLFDPARKRELPYPPRRIGLVASEQSAAYHDFLKILSERWGGVTIELADVQVQGDAAVGQVVAALEYFNTHDVPVDVLVVTRGGGSPEDLAAFSTEQVTRAVAASRIPTLVAIGHEIDTSLAELAADQRASTPSNAAQMLVPERRAVFERVALRRRELSTSLERVVTRREDHVTHMVHELHGAVEARLEDAAKHVSLRRQVLEALSPTAAMRRGYAILTNESGTVTSVTKLRVGQGIAIRLHDGRAEAQVTRVTAD